MWPFWEAPAAVAAIGGLLMAVDSYWPHIVACCVFGISGVWALIGGLVWMKSVTRWTSGAYARAAGTVLFSLGMFAAIWAAWPSSLKAQIPNINGNCNNNYGTFNNSNCGNIFNVEPQRLRFTDQVRRALLAEMPRDKKWKVVIIGTAADRQIGMEVYDFLRSSGYDLASPPFTAENYAPMPNHRLTIANTPDSKLGEIIIAPSAR